MSEIPTEIPPQCLAIVVYPNDHVELLVPSSQESISEMQIATSMLAIKLMQDPEWVADLVAEFKSDSN